MSAFVAMIVAIAATPRPPAPPPLVIPPGEEKLVIQMVGGNDTLPGGCRCEDANIDESVIRVTWKCGQARVEGTLASVDAPGVPLAKTRKFEVFQRGTVPWPAGLANAVAARIEAHEAEFRWLAPAATPVVVVHFHSRPTTFWRCLGPILLGALLVAAFVGWRAAARRHA